MDFAEPSLPLAVPDSSGPDVPRMPLLGLGTWQIPEDEAAGAVRTALEYGYRHVDTATRYRNESGVGRGLADAGVARDDIFVTTKFPPDRVGEERAILEQSLSALGVDRLDLWLVHAPGGEDRSDPLVSTWEHFVAAQSEGLVTSIGVSNYTVEQIDTLTEATGVRPAVNQIKWSPAHHDPAVAAAHAERGVVLEGYSAFRTSNLDDPVLTEIAEAHDATTAQVIVGWHVAHQWVIIPKSTHAERIRANADGIRIELTDDEVARIDGLRQ